jgi:hypothetical protein
MVALLWSMVALWSSFSVVLVLLWLSGLAALVRWVRRLEEGI